MIYLLNFHIKILFVSIIILSLKINKPHQTSLVKTRFKTNQCRHEGLRKIVLLYIKIFEKISGIIITLLPDTSPRCIFII